MYDVCRTQNIVSRFEWIFATLLRTRIVNNRIVATFTLEITLHGEHIHTYTIYIWTYQCLFAMTRLNTACILRCNILVKHQLSASENPRLIFFVDHGHPVHRDVETTFLCQQVVQRRVSCSSAKIFTQVSHDAILTVLRAMC